jgi:uncharacterized MAPEG superfamily protein
MNANLSAELYWMTLTALLTGLLWLPYILNQILCMGMWKALSNSDSAQVVRADWARRAAAAHTNAVENLVVFAPLAIAVHLLGVGSELTATAAAAYFFLRVAHYVVYMLAVPVLRTLLFAGGVACQVTLAVAVLGAA